MPRPAPVAAAPSALWTEVRAHPAVRPAWLLDLGRLCDPLPVLRGVAATLHAHEQNLRRLVDLVGSRLVNPEQRLRLVSAVAAAQQGAQGRLAPPARRLGRLCNALAVGLGDDARGRALAARWHERIAAGLVRGGAAFGVGALAFGGESLALLLQQRLPAAARDLDLPERVRRAVADLQACGDDPCRVALRHLARRLAAGPGLCAELRRGMALALSLQDQTWTRLYRRACRQQDAA